MTRCAGRLASGYKITDSRVSVQSNFPLSVTVTHTPIRIGVIHGHQCIPTGDLDSLSAIARQLDVDVLVSGHTHTCVFPPLYTSCEPQLSVV